VPNPEKKGLAVVAPAVAVDVAVPKVVRGAALLAGTEKLKTLFDIVVVAG
jgi:hypothetical protein